MEPSVAVRSRDMEETAVSLVRPGFDGAGAPGGPKTARSCWWHGRYGRRLLVEIFLVVVTYQGYKWARLLTRHQDGVAFKNARQVARWEQSVGLLIEDDLQRLALSSPDVIWFLNRYYTYVHFTTMVTFLIWLYVRHGSIYGRVRRVLLGTTVVSLAIHLWYPLAPPRMMPSMGFVDTISRFGPQIYDDPAVAAVVNQIAAMPSLHFGWSIIVAWAVVRALRHTARWVVILHPALTLAAIVLTANHWWLDAAVAAVIVVAVAFIDAAVLRDRGGVRRDSPDPTEAARSSRLIGPSR